ncbi:hypothetical protein RHGRI_027730 [Rhododendron griersonianum]|uniref:hydroxyacylglutathione hydrolase n=1 Tax=Rhododendron griersonianum TaxID=479676 RepID=A0AAV6J161_9ERIC|nr:hypothetical protein RHGRI_027730 [Rhododendron griersonianum]
MYVCICEYGTAFVLNLCCRIIDEATKEGAAVDPVEPDKVLGVAKENGVELKSVLTTHHHWSVRFLASSDFLHFHCVIQICGFTFMYVVHDTDACTYDRDHAGGNEKIKELVPGIRVYGGSLDNVKGCTNKVENGDRLSIGKDINILALHTPCHTKGHISYYLTGKAEEDPAVFTGDTLFVAGCGKFFEGTAEQMYQSLCVTLASLPKPTRVYCGHEYTVKNLQFARTVEPENAKIAHKLSWAQHQRQTGLPTIPSTIEEELETNPFMRVDLPEVQEKVGCKSPVDALREIRQRKDNWRG